MLANTEIAFVEWGASSYFSFLEGCASPSDLMERCLENGLHGVGLADRMGLYGCVEALRAIEELKQHSNPIISKKAQHFFYAPGIRLHFDHADPLLVYPLHKKAHSRLCTFLSDWAMLGMEEKKQEKGLAPLSWKEFLNFLRTHRATLNESFVLISVPGQFFPWTARSQKEFKRIQSQDVLKTAPTVAIPPQERGHFPFWMQELAQVCGTGRESCLSLAWPLTLSPGIKELQQWLLEQSLQTKIPLLATSLPLMTQADDFELAQLVCSIRHRSPLKEIGLLGQVNAQRRPNTLQELSWHKHIYQQHMRRNLNQSTLPSLSNPPPCPFKRSVELAQRHNFSLKELRYSYPVEKIPNNMNSSQYLRKLTFEGAQRRYSDNIPFKVVQQINHELDLIEKLKFEDYFLTIDDILRYAKEKDILFQGRGSAANSAVCYCLGITAIDPIQMDLLFERFLSIERHEPPDIDIDFEHERREEVIQEIYSRYGRHRSAMVANTIRFRGRMAMRESGKALGLSEEELATINHYMGREGMRIFTESLDPKEKRRKANENSNTVQHHLKNFNPRIRKTLPRLLRLAQKLVGLPRHMGIHSCGFVLAHGDLRHECLLEPARKEKRSIIPWNKDDVDFLGWVKVDFLSLGMLTAIRKCFQLIGPHNPTGKALTLASVPHDCPQTYQAIRRADTVGVFQIESRAQMNMLPQLAPKNFYDLVIEVAIVRPGPLQGGMVHPFIRRKQGKEKPTYVHPRLEKVLGKTLGVPIFQEQVMKMAVEVADFTPGEAEQMRKVMSSAWRSRSQMHRLYEKLIKGMLNNGISRQYAESIYRQIEAFGEYGFPESHSASFAILAYVSAWLKTHYPAAFLCAILNSQPMGFYSARALIDDARRHGTQVLPPNIRFSRSRDIIEAPLSDDSLKQGPVRLGLQHIHGLKREAQEKIERLQDHNFFRTHSNCSLRDLRLHLPPSAIEKVIRANAFKEEESEKLLWQFQAIQREDPQAPQLFYTENPSGAYQEKMCWNEWQKLLNNYKTLGFSLKEHPAHYARTHFFPLLRHWKLAEELWHLKDKEKVAVLGLLSVKQKPPTAKGMCFLTLEDESGFMNIVIEPKLYAKVRTQINSAPLLAIEGHVQKTAPLNVHDAKTSTLSIWTEKLWNPFKQSSSGRSHPFQRRQKHADPTGR